MRVLQTLIMTRETEYILKDKARFEKAVYLYFCGFSVNDIGAAMKINPRYILRTLERALSGMRRGTAGTGGVGLRADRSVMKSLSAVVSVQKRARSAGKRRRLAEKN